MKISNFIYTVMVVFLISVISSSCQTKNHNNDSESHAGHMHEDEDDHSGHDHAADTQEDDHAHSYSLRSYTQINGNYELFMEATPLIIGDKFEATIFITKLDSYKPIKSNHISLILTGTKILKINAHGHNNGIFHTSFIPTMEGKANLVVTFADAGISQKISIDSLFIFNHDNFQEGETEEEANLINYIKEQAWAEEFEITELQEKQFSRVIKTSGKILPAPGDETIITAMHSGTISLNNRLIEGKKVKKGDALSVISSNLIHQNLTNDYLEAKNKFEKAELDFKRATELIAEKLISEKEYLVTKLDYESTKNTFNNIAKYYSDGNENIYAPKTGYVRSVFVQQGQFIEEGQPIATIIQNKRILLKADVPQQYNHLASGFYTANFSPVYTNELFKIADFNGHRTSYSSALAKNSLFTSVHFEFDAHKDIMPGSYVEVYLKSASTHEVLTVPVSALMEDQGNYFVFVMVDGEHYRKTYIKIGDSDGEYIEVISGLVAGDYVVSKGTYQIHLASLGNAAPAHSHSH